jgi:hypothetical protein
MTVSELEDTVAQLWNLDSDYRAKGLKDRPAARARIRQAIKRLEKQGIELGPGVPGKGTG